jgi:hypothetical protein
VTALALTVVEASAKRSGGARLMDNALQRRTELNSLWRAHLRIRVAAVIRTVISAR